MTELKKVSNDKLKREIKSLKGMFYFYLTITIILLTYGFLSMSTLVFIAYFTFFIISLFIVGMIINLKFIVETREGIQDIKDILKIQEEGDNYDKRA